MLFHISHQSSPPLRPSSSPNPSVLTLSAVHGACWRTRLPFFPETHLIKPIDGAFHRIYADPVQGSSFSEAFIHFWVEGSRWIRRWRRMEGFRRFWNEGVSVGGGGGERGYRRVRKRALKSTRKQKELEVSVNILIEEGLPNDPEILSISEMLRLNAPLAMKSALEGLKDSEYKTRDTAINDVGGYETIELSVLLCNDEFIRKLNKEWRDEDHATAVLSMSQHIPELEIPMLMLGDIVISVETAARQAEERGHTLLDEIRILLVHGLLHLLGFDHEISDEAEVEMETEEELLLTKLGWKGKGLIKSAYDAENDGCPHVEKPDVCSERILHDDY